MSPVVDCDGEIEVDTESRPCDNEMRYLGSRTSVTCPDCGHTTPVGGPSQPRDTEITMSDLRERRAERREMLGFAFADGGVPQ